MRRSPRWVFGATSYFNANKSKIGAKWDPKMLGRGSCFPIGISGEYGEASHVLWLFSQRVTHPYRNASAYEEPWKSLLSNLKEDDVRVSVDVLEGGSGDTVYERMVDETCSVWRHDRADIVGIREDRLPDAVLAELASEGDCEPLLHRLSPLGILACSLDLQRRRDSPSVAAAMGDMAQTDDDLPARLWERLPELKRALNGMPDFGKIASELLEADLDKFDHISSDHYEIDNDPNVTIHWNSVSQTLDHKNRQKLHPQQTSATEISLGNGRTLLATAAHLNPGALGAPVVGATGLLRGIVEHIVPISPSNPAGMVICIDGPEIGRFISAIESRVQSQK